MQCARGKYQDSKKILILILIVAQRVQFKKSLMYVYKCQNNHRYNAK